MKGFLLLETVKSLSTSFVSCIVVCDHNYVYKYSPTVVHFIFTKQKLHPKTNPAFHIYQAEITSQNKSCHLSCTMYC